MPVIKNKILKLDSLRTLSIEKPLQPGRPSHISAASGLVQLDTQFFVISDDENALFSFSETSPIQAIPISKKNLPVESKARKKEKDDHESLAVLPENWLGPRSALLAFPSGSTANRRRASLIPTAAGRGNVEAPLDVDLSPLFLAMESETKDLNIEGVVVLDEKTYFFQRGNGDKGKNGVFDIPNSEFQALLKNRPWKKESLKFRKIKLGKLDKVKLSITDACRFSKGILLLAAAEDTDSTYLDGEVKGTVLAAIEDIENSTDVKILGRLSPNVKMEGVFVEKRKSEEIAYFVDDADDPSKASQLFRLQLTTILTGQ